MHLNVTQNFVSMQYNRKILRTSLENVILHLHLKFLSKSVEMCLMCPDDLKIAVLR